MEICGLLLAQLCRIMSYRKYAYDLERAKKNKMKEMGVVSMKKSKGMRFTDRIGKGDIDTKVRLELWRAAARNNKCNVDMNYFSKREQFMVLRLHHTHTDICVIFFLISSPASAGSSNISLPADRAPGGAQLPQEEGACDGGACG